MNQPHSRKLEAGTEQPPVNAVGAVDASDPSYTLLWDWVWMSTAPDQAKVYYWALRSFVYEKDKNHVVEVSDDEIAELIHRSTDSAARARKKAEEHGLVTVLEEKRRHGYTNGKKHSLPVLRKISVQIQPPEGYAGWSNPFEARAAIRARQSGSANLPNRRDQQTVDNYPSGMSTCQDGSANLPSREADLPNRGANLPANTPADQQEPAPQVSLQVSNEPTNQSGPGETPSGGESGLAGWLGATPQEDEDARAAAAPSSTEGRTLLQRWGVAGRPLDEWAGVVDDAIATLGHTEAESALTADLNGVNSPARVIVGYRLPALRDRLSAAKNTPTAGPTKAAKPWCGECDEISRLYEAGGGRWAKCSCHPRSGAERPRAQQSSDKALLAQLATASKQ